ncbi:MAG TPA: glucose-6-phosphate dehydrogenase [Candidatus Wallbacteria bacterium]|nr:glucose-6-phosphate dehydrogenase [Candidatus Wallbacteria bacterium]
MAIFGVTGDLALKKIFPAIYNLYSLGFLDEKTHIVGIGRRKYSNIEYNEYISDILRSSGVPGGERSEILKNEDIKKKFIAMNSYICADFSDMSSFAAIREGLKAVALKYKICNFLYYLSTPPQNFIEIISGLGSSGLSKPDFLDIICAGSFVRIVIEKPYGRDLASAKKLNEMVLSVFSEDQIYRIDHYLGKETVQNIMVFRFLNGIFEPVWNQKYIDSVQIKVFETEGIGKRANYFDNAGIIRDIIQNHSLQMLSLIAIEPINSMAAENIRNEKLKALSAIRPFDVSRASADLVLAQYTAGRSGSATIPAYIDEPGISKDSRTETFAAIRLYIDNWRWAGVPFYLSAGKRMSERLTEVIVTFKPAPHMIFKNICDVDDYTKLKDADSISPSCSAPANKLIIRIQPDEGISLKIFSKIPGFEMGLQPVMMNFNYSTSFNGKLPEAYERLILDSLLGDATLFMRSDEIEASWEYITPVLECIKACGVPLKHYEANSPGPSLCEFFGLNIC